MARLLWTLVLVLASGSIYAATTEGVRFNEIRVHQFARHDQVKLHGGTIAHFAQSTATACPVANDGTRFGPLAASLGGILLDWLFSRATTHLSEKLKERIAAHSASYRSPAIFRDMLASGLWTASGESCLVMQRIECTVSAESVENGTASCGPDGVVGLSIGLKLRSEGKLIRVLPIAIALQKLQPRHHQGEATVAATFRLEAIGFDPGPAAGFSWKSEDVPIGSIACDVGKDRIPTGDCIRTFSLGAAEWAESPAIPMPPSPAQTAVFVVGEVGEPSQGLKGFSAFLEANKDALSGAFSAAFQKKIGLTE